jgi:Xaa-Pro aminopeptidase
MKLNELKLDAFLISSHENRRYISGFTGSSGYLLISQNQSILCTDFRYIEQAEEQSPSFKVERIRGSLHWFSELCNNMNAQIVGFEGSDLNVNSYQAFVESIQNSNIKLKSTAGIIEKLRGIKDEYELALLIKSVQIADEAIDEIIPTIEAGQTESEIAWKLEKSMRNKGAESLSFDIIVGAGPNSALPHHRADNVSIKNGQPIVIDMGCKYQGYCSDLTRTIFIGEPDETFKKIYNLVLGAQLTAETTLQAGMTAGDVDNLARDLISKAGYGENFGHGLGHGVGLAIHEYPGIGPNADSLMENGMVFTIEPGIYIPGWGGVRIEDVVVLENGIARVLSKAKKIK